MLFRIFRYGLLALAMLFLVPGSLFSQKPWTLDDCISYARENNLALKRQELLARISRNNYLRSVLEFGPDLNAFGRHNLSSGKTVNLEDYTYINTTFFDGYAGVQSVVTLFGGLQNWNAMLQNRYALQASIMDVEKAKNDLSINITGAFLQVLLDMELLKIAQSQLGTTELQLQRIRKMVELGSMAQAQLLEIRAQAASEKSQVTASENRLKLSQLTLRQLLDVDTSADFQIAVPVLPEIEETLLLAPVGPVYDYARFNFPEIKSAEYSLMESKKYLATARGERSPRLNLVGTLYSRYSELAVDPLDPTSFYPIASQMDDNFYKQVSLNLNIPIFNRGSVQNSISNARVMVDDARLRLDQIEKQLYKEIEQAYSDASAAMDNYLSAAEAVSSLEEAFKHTEQRFNLGSASSVDYTLAKGKLVMAQANMMQARYTYFLYSKILDFYNGKPISL